MITTFKKYHKDIICYILIIISLLLSIFYFKIAPIRFKESLIDLKTTGINYFCNLFDIDYNGATITEYSSVEYKMPFGLPRTWSEFTLLFKNYWSIFFTKESFLGYFSLLVDILYYVSQIVLILSGPILIIVIIKAFKKTDTNNKYNKKSNKLWKWINFEKKVLLPIKEWILNFIQFFNNNEVYKPILILIWCWNFNIIVIILELIAYYFYFVASFNLANLYVQILKLLMDLSVVYDFLPGLIKITLTIIIIDIIRKNIGYKNLNHMENRNKGFINELPILSFGYGSMGTGKTKLATDMALSQEVIFRSKALELMLECDLKFPNFSWINLEMELKEAIDNHNIYNLLTCEKFIKNKEEEFIKSLDLDPKVLKSIIRNLKKRKGYKYNNFIFDYDFEYYGLFNNNQLKNEYIFDVILDYSKLYFIYIINTSLIISNYSIRSDNIKDDIGNFPLWNMDFFKRDPINQDFISRHSHLLDYDMFRLGKKVLDSKYSNMFEFGVVVISEVGKERKNALELQATKLKDALANQKNDLFEKYLKMIRHGGTVMNYCFVKLFTEEQRPESWGADARDLCELIFIDKVQEKNILVPIFFIDEIIHHIIFNNYDYSYYQRRYERGDIKLWDYLKHNLISKLHNYYNRMYNIFGCTKLNLQLESGRMDDKNPIEKSYYMMDKKIYSNRYSTDCYSSFFKMKSSKSEYGLIDLPEYQNIKASTEEMTLQNSYFYQDLTYMFNQENNK